MEVSINIHRHACSFNIFRATASVYVKVGERTPLIMVALLNRKNKISDEVLYKLALHYEVEDVGGETPRWAMLSKLAARVSGGDDDFVAEVLEAEKVVVDNMVDLTSDPMFDAAYGDLDTAEQAELKSFSEARQRGKIRKYKEAFGIRMGRRKGKGKGKGRGEGKGKGNGRGDLPPAAPEPPAPEPPALEPPAAAGLPAPAAAPVTVFQQPAASPSMAMVRRI